MAKPSDLCTLSQAKTWLGVTNTDSDALLALLISAASRTLLAYINRSIYPGTRTETRDGVGSNRMQLAEWPVQSVSSLTIDGTAIAANARPLPNGSGFYLVPGDVDPPGSAQMLILAGYLFCKGWGNVVVTYHFGYIVQAEAATIPVTSAYTVTPAAPYGAWCADQGVTYANGTPLVPVATAPAHGQYTVDANGLYTFAAADAGLAVLVSYGFVPVELAEAAIQTVGEWFRGKDRIGITSKGLAGQEQIVYSQKDLSNVVKQMVASYVRVSPL